jgi:hypothetical protein
MSHPRSHVSPARAAAISRRISRAAILYATPAEVSANTSASTNDTAGQKFTMR